MKVSIIGAGLIGQRRAKFAASAGDKVVAVYDTDRITAASLAEPLNAITAESPEEAVEAADIVVVSTPNKFLLPTATAAMNAGRHVLIEKPMGRNLHEAWAFVNLQKAHPDLVLKIGFNHRYHPAIAEAHARLASGSIGDISFIRAVYGHGGRPGYEKEWRGSRELSGGGELTDQGVHLLDLICWFSSRPDWTFAQRRTCAWTLDGLEDNGFFVLGWNNETIAQVHTSWTQWKNRFALEIYGTNGAVEIHGLGGSYGPETLTIYRRKPEGGTPEVETKDFNGDDLSWALEWSDFRHAIDTQSSPMGNTADGLNVMKTLDAIYKSCESNCRINV